MNSFSIYHGAAKPIIARGKHQAALLHHAFHNPGWRCIRDKDKAEQRALAALAVRGCMEVRPSDVAGFTEYQFRFPNTTEQEAQP